MFLAAAGMEAQRCAQPRRNQSRCACVVCGSTRNSRRELLDSFFFCAQFMRQWLTCTHTYRWIQLCVLVHVRQLWTEALLVQSSTPTQTQTRRHYSQATWKQCKRRRRFMIIAVHLDRADAAVVVNQTAKHPLPCSRIQSHKSEPLAVSHNSVVKKMEWWDAGLLLA